VNGIALVLRVLHHGERELAQDLTAVALRHTTEHEVRHVATDLARWSGEHIRRLAEEAARRGGPGLDPDTPDRTGGPAATVREKVSRAVGRRPEPGLLLLRDLRDLYLGASRNSLYWEMLAQAGQAAKDTRLLDIAADCHPQTLRQVRWANTMIKNLSPQILTGL
jgi:hypothetical protein